MAQLPRVKHMPPYRIGGRGVLTPEGVKPGVTLTPDAVLYDARVIESNDGQNIVAIWAETNTPVIVPYYPYEVWIDSEGSEICLLVSTHCNPMQPNVAYGDAERQRVRRAGWRPLYADAASGGFISDGREPWEVAVKGACPEDEARIEAFKAEGRKRAEVKNKAAQKRGLQDITKEKGLAEGMAKVLDAMAEELNAKKADRKAKGA